MPCRFQGPSVLTTILLSSLAPSYGAPEGFKAVATDHKAPHVFHTRSPVWRVYGILPDTVAFLKPIQAVQTLDLEEGGVRK